MKHNKNARIMEHIIEYCEDVTEAVRRFEGDKRKFMSDRRAGEKLDGRRSAIRCFGSVERNQGDERLFRP